MSEIRPVHGLEVRANTKDAISGEVVYVDFEVVIVLTEDGRRITCAKEDFALLWSAR